MSTLRGVQNQTLRVFTSGERLVEQMDEGGNENGDSEVGQLDDQKIEMVIKDMHWKADDKC